MYCVDRSPSNFIDRSSGQRSGKKEGRKRYGRREKKDNSSRGLLTECHTNVEVDGILAITFIFVFQNIIR